MSRPHGVGLAWRPEFLEAAEALLDQVDCVELLIDDYLGTGPLSGDLRPPLEAGMPLIAHATVLSPGSADFACGATASHLGAVLDRFGIEVWSEHLSWSQAGGFDVPNFFPVARTWSEVDRVAANVQAIQRRVGRRVALENIVSFLDDPRSELSEGAFLARVAEAADCGILLDVNNLWVQSRNRGFDPYAFLDELDGDRVMYLHIAGHDQAGDLLVDSHAQAVASPVWALAARALRRTSAEALVLERDNRSATPQQLLSELALARGVWQAARGSQVQRRAG